MILESVENGLLIWPTIEENGVTRTKKYVELSPAEKIQADCDMKATNLYLFTCESSQSCQGFIGESLITDARFTDIKGESLHKYYLRFTQLINDMNIYNMKMEQFQVNTKFLNSLPPEWRDDPIACLNKAMAFLTDVASSRQCTQPKRPRNAAWYKDKALLAEAQEARQILDEEQLAYLGVPDGQAVQTIIPNNAAFQTEDLDTYDSNCNDISNAKAVLMANISNYGSEVISDVPHSETYLNDMENQSVHAIQDFE
ncbi:hypothetical protein Tco_0530702 [Tanacetum coccineum]